MKKITLALIVLFNTINVNAQWSSNTAVNNAISTAFSNQERPAIVSDGSGGAIITWEDYRSLNDYDIYAQRINASGVVQWTTNGVAICVLAGANDRPAIVSDGNGGAIITWQDWRGTNGDIYAQRINASGVVQWTTNGVAITTALRNQYNLKIVSDGNAGAIITWQDFRSSSSEDIYAQRINASGVVQWTADGVAISAASAPGSGNQTVPSIASDGNGGAIITWEDTRGGLGQHIYGQRINAGGAVQWTANGVEVCGASGYQYKPTIISDGIGGAIITWHDYGTISGNNNDIYAQRINASGAAQWTTNGVAICTLTESQSQPTIVTDGNSGAIIGWLDYRNYINTGYDIFAQRINANGAVQWTANGVAISTATDSQQSQTMVSDGIGGAIITWDDQRIMNNTNVYAQRINSSGAIQWTANGAPVTTATGSQGSTAITSNGSSGAIIAWADSRGGAPDIYAQRISPSGTLANSVFEKQTIAIYPNPSNGVFTLKIDDISAVKNIAVYTVLGQKIVSKDITTNTSSIDISGQPKGVYFYTVSDENDGVKSGKLIIE